MTTTTIDGNNYRAGRLNALQQFHVGRRLAPIMAAMGAKAVSLTAPVGDRASDREGAEPAGNMLADFVPMLPVIAEIISKMSDEDTDYVIFTSLSAIEREAVPGQWQLMVPNPAQRRLMFQDIDAAVMMRLVAFSLQENLSGFLKVLGDPQPSPST